MSIDDDFFDVGHEVERTEVEQSFDRICKYVNVLEVKEERLQKENRDLVRSFRILYHDVAVDETSVKQAQDFLSETGIGYSDVTWIKLTNLLDSVKGVEK